MEDETSGPPKNYNMKNNSFISYLRWGFVDESNIWRKSVSWSVFFVLAIVVPLVSHLLLYSDHHTSPAYDIPLQLSLSVFATLSFFCLSRWDRNYGITNFLFIHKVCHDCHKIQRRYAQQLQRTIKVMLVWGLPCFAAECVYKTWWYISGGAYQIPHFIDNIYISSIILCLLQLSSWLYRTSIFLVVCVLFRLICYLQILRLEHFSQLLFHQQTELASILMEHLKIRRNLRIISHRFRAFILASLFLVTATHLVFLLITTRPGAHIDILKDAELMLVSITLVSGLFILLRSATKITHKAQSITCLASKWHICSTISSFDTIYDHADDITITPTQDDDDDDDVGDEEDDLDNTHGFIPKEASSSNIHGKQQSRNHSVWIHAGQNVAPFHICCSISSMPLAT